ncbi:MAG: uroporphyrinogen-III synthase [Mariprofundus sp.]|nr:uroporphyrinogen-III synthase [Mariprofundus sp.]
MPCSGLREKQILLTRAEKYYPALSQVVESFGATPVSLPCLAIEDMPQSIAIGMRLLENCSDVLFTSASGVHAVAKVMADAGRGLFDALLDRRIAAVGRKTANALSLLGVGVDIMPTTASQDGLIEAYEANGLPDGLLFFRAEQGRDTLVESMLQHGVRVAMAPAYRTICPSGDADNVIAKLQAGEIDAVLLGSAKTASHYLQRVGSLELANRPVIAAISANMAIAARVLGLDVQVVAKEASFEAMLDALAEYYNSGSR